MPFTGEAEINWSGYQPWCRSWHLECKDSGSVKTVDRPYHHGNLRNELIRVGLELASEGGLNAVGLREASRRIGVSPSAAYRHFESQADLVQAVRNRLLESMDEKLQLALSEVEGEDVVSRIRALGVGYFKFALDNPKQFEVFTFVFPLAEDWATASGRPMQILTSLMKEVKPDAEDLFAEAVPVWAAFHGATFLCTLGSLRNHSDEEKWAVQESTADLVLRGLNLIP